MNTRCDVIFFWIPNWIRRHSCCRVRIQTEAFSLSFLWTRTHQLKRVLASFENSRLAEVWDCSSEQQRSLCVDLETESACGEGSRVEGGPGYKMWVWKRGLIVKHSACPSTALERREWGGSQQGDRFAEEDVWAQWPLCSLVSTWLDGVCQWVGGEECDVWFTVLARVITHLCSV